MLLSVLLLSYTYTLPCTSLLCQLLLSVHHLAWPDLTQGKLVQLVQEPTALLPIIHIPCPTSSPTGKAVGP